MTIPQFVLASASPARRRLLQTVGIQPIVAPSGFDESQVQDTDPARLVQTLAWCKAETVAPSFSSALVMGCDSVLAMNGAIYGKPANPQDAIPLVGKLCKTIMATCTLDTLLSILPKIAN